MISDTQPPPAGQSRAADIVLGHLGAQIRQARIARNISQVDLAARIGLHRGNLARIESGEQPNVSVARILHIAALLQVPVVDWLSGLEVMDGGDTDGSGKPAGGARRILVDRDTSDMLTIWRGLSDRERKPLLRIMNILVEKRRVQG